MFTMQCDQCNKLAIKEKPLKLPIRWWTIFYDGEEYHLCSSECAIAFFGKKSRDNEEKFIDETPIENLDLSVRVFNSLRRTGITTVGEVVELLEKGEEAVMSIHNFGEKSLDELRQKMREKGYL